MSTSNSMNMNSSNINNNNGKILNNGGPFKFMNKELLKNFFE
jgi:hypothetical protein